ATPPRAPGDSDAHGDALDLGVLGDGPISLVEAVGFGVRSDNYRITLDRTVELEVTLSGVGEPASVWVGVANAQNRWARTIRGASSGTGVSAAFRQDLEPGVYYIRVDPNHWTYQTTYVLGIVAISTPAEGSSR
ncbi:MAG: hypothetical protein AB7O66_09770, partial [Limisphaerales bacterium]